MPIRLRFLLVSNILLVGLGIIGFVAIRDVQHASDTFSQAARDSIDHVQLSDQIRANLPDLRALELEYITTSDLHDQAAVLQEMEAKRNALKQVMNHYEFDQDKETGPGCVSCHQAFSRYAQSNSQVKTLVSQGKTTQALSVYQASSEQYTALLTEAETFRQSQYSAAREESLRGSAMAEEARNILIGCFVAAAVLLFIIGHAMSSYIHRRLRRLMDGTRRVIGGNLSQPIEVEGRDEFGQLGKAFNAMTESLQKSQAENLNLHDVAIRMREERIKLLSDGLRRAVEAQENERQRVSRELHDGVGQALTALQLGLGRLEMNTRSPTVKDAASSLRDLSVSTLQEIRDLARDLRPSMLDEMGLEPTLRNYVKEFAERIRTPIALHASGLAGRLPQELEVTVFRIVQEGLSNMAKHAGASHGRVDLAQADGALTLIVEDDGAGFDVATVRATQGRSLGLSGMEERCRFSDGDLEIESAPGQGTKLVCRWRLSSDVLAPPQAGPPAGRATNGRTGDLIISTGSGGQS